jgi:hypothetical protein
VQASHAEGSGGALIDALACGTTPLVTDIPSFRKITGDGACGALFPVGNAAALAGAIREWGGRDWPTLRRRARAHFERALSFGIGHQLCAATSRCGADERRPWHVRPYRSGDRRPSLPSGPGVRQTMSEAHWRWKAKGRASP